MEKTRYEIADVIRGRCAVNVRDDEFDNNDKEFEHKSLNRKSNAHINGANVLDVDSHLFFEY